jgi:hypothetical protein
LQTLTGSATVCYIFSNGTVAKWQGRALQKLDQRFESARCLPYIPQSQALWGFLFTP